jgi:hypothetical protein
MRTFPLLCVLFIAAGARAQTSYPMITHATPVAVQRGTTATVVVSGQMNFAGAYKVLFEGKGIAAEVQQPAKPAAVTRSVTLKVKVDADAALGVREFRIATSLGVSSIGQLVVSEHPVVVEKGDNDTQQKANPIPVPCVAVGAIEKAVDVDHFRFTAKAGQTFTFEVLCARLQDKIHDLQKHADPILTLYDGTGRELAANDDYFFADPLLTYTFTKDGDYVVQVRDSKYDGDPRWVYALLVSDRPHATHVYPLAGNPGKDVTVEPVGSAAQAKAKVVVKAPDTPGLHEVALDLGGTRTNPVPLLVSDLPQVLEVEPNDTPETATRVSIPCGINGRIGKPRDLDHFVFKATKGKAIRFEVKARRFGTLLRSTLDSVLDVMNAKGAVLATSDDAPGLGKDSALVFTPLADGDYVLRIRDLNSKGGLAAIYYIEVDWARPDFTLRCDGDKAMIGPGSRAAWFVQVARVNGFAGPVKVEVKGLPGGVTASELTIPANMTQGVVVLSAAVDAPRDAANVEMVATGTVTVDGKEQTLTRRAAVGQEVYFPGGGRGTFDVNLQTVAVTAPSDVLDVVVTPADVELKPGQEVKLEVTVQRRAGFDKGVSLDVILRHLGRQYGNPLPPGVTLVEGKSKTLLGSGSKGHLVLRAAPDAVACQGVPICVMAQVSVNFVVKIGYASAPIRVTVRR